jgi:hypothetical protein
MAFQLHVHHLTPSPDSLQQPQGLLLLHTCYHTGKPTADHNALHSHHIYILYLVDAKKGEYTSCKTATRPKEQELWLLRQNIARPRHKWPQNAYDQVTDTPKRPMGVGSLCHVGDQPIKLRETNKGRRTTMH